MNRSTASRTPIPLTFAAVAICLLLPAPSAAAQGAGDLRSVIVQAPTIEQAELAVSDVGGEVTHRLAIIRAVGALLDDARLRALESRPDAGLRVVPNRVAEVAGKGVVNANGKGKGKGIDKQIEKKGLDTE